MYLVTPRQYISFKKEVGGQCHYKGGEEWLKLKGEPVALRAWEGYEVKDCRALGLDYRGWDRGGKVKEEEIKERECITIIIPSRERELLLVQCIDSLIKNTKGEVEVLVVCDTDDKTGYEKFKGKYRNIEVKVIRRERSKRLNADYYNWAVKGAKGEYVMVGNDDMVFETEGWDDNARRGFREAKERYGDGIAYGSTYCGDGSSGSFPLVSKEAIDVLGGMMNDKIWGWTADGEINRVFKAVDRIISLDIDIFHDSPHMKTREKDATNMGMETNYFTEEGVEEEVKSRINKLRKRMEGICI